MKITALTASLKARWLSMSLRDQRALLSLSAFFIVVGLWLGVAKPAMHYAQSGRQSLEQAQADLAWMQANAMIARQAGATQGEVLGAGGESLLSIVNTTARADGLNLQRFEPDGNQRVRVTLEGAVFTDVMRWIVTLESQAGLRVESFSADPQGKPGVVNIRLTLGRPS